MATENDTDRSGLLDTDEFAESFTVGASSFNGIFDDSYRDDDDVESSVPTITMRTTDLTTVSISRGTSVTRDSDSVVYAVREIHNDGTGMTILTLEEQ